MSMSTVKTMLVIFFDAKGVFSTTRLFYSQWCLLSWCSRKIEKKGLSRAKGDPRYLSAPSYQCSRPQRSGCPWAPGGASLGNTVPAPPQFRLGFCCFQWLSPPLKLTILVALRRFIPKWWPLWTRLSSKPFRWRTMFWKIVGKYLKMQNESHYNLLREYFQKVFQ